MQVDLTKETIDHIKGVIAYLWDDELRCCLETTANNGGEECGGCAFEHVRCLAQFLDDHGVKGYRKMLKKAAKEEAEEHEMARQAA